MSLYENASFDRRRRPDRACSCSSIDQIRNRFVIIDKKEATTPYSKAIGVQARTLEIYEQIGMADNLIAKGSITEKAQLVEGGEVRAEI